MPECSKRRSERKSKEELLSEQQDEIKSRLLNTDDSTLDIEICLIQNKGRGVQSSRPFSKGEFITEYAGELISGKEASSRWTIQSNQGYWNLKKLTLFASGSQFTSTTRVRAVTCSGSNIKKQIIGKCFTNAVQGHSWLSGNKDCHEYRFSIFRIVISVSNVTSL